MKLVYNDTTHSYWLDGRRVKSASKVAKIAADNYTIEQWQKRQVAIGMTIDRTLSERVAVDLDNREAIQAVCDDAARAAKSNARADRGIQRHRVFELLLLGMTDMLLTDQQRADAKVLERTLDAYGLEPIPDRVEQFVAWPDHGVVGRYDAYLRHEGRPVLTDLKSGINAVKYPHSTAVQLPLYRFAPHTSAAIVRDGDRSEVTEWTTAPDGADEEVAYVLHCDDDHDVGELWRIDLAGGRRGAELALSIVDWRKAHNYGRALAELIPVPGNRRAQAPPQPPAAPDRRASIVARIKALIDAGHGETLSKRWPEGIPGFGTTHPHTDAEIAQVHAVVQRLEDDNGFGFHPDDAPPPEPTPEPVEPELPPAATVLDDGKRVSVEARDQLNAAYAALDPAQRGDVDRLRSELPQWASPPGCGPYLRHWEILRTAVLWAEAGWDDDIVRDLTAAVTGDDAVRQPAVKIGEAWAALTIAQALELAELARLVLDGTHQVNHHQDRWRLSPAA